MSEPSFYPEGGQPKPLDTSHKCLQKIVGNLYDLVQEGGGGPGGPFIAKNNGTGTNTSLSGDAATPALTVTQPDSTKGGIVLYNTALGATNGLELRNGYGPAQSPAFVIPTFRPTTSGYGVGFDIMANTAGLAANTRKPVWMDLCPYDFQTASGSQQEFARYGYEPGGDSTVVVLGSNAFNTGVFRNLIAQPYGGKMGVGKYSTSSSTTSPDLDFELYDSVSTYRMGFDKTTLFGAIDARRIASYTHNGTQRAMLLQAGSLYESVDGNSTGNYPLVVDSGGTTNTLALTATGTVTVNGTSVFKDASAPDPFVMQCDSATPAFTGVTARRIACYANATQKPLLIQASTCYWTVDGNATIGAFLDSTGFNIATVKFTGGATATGSGSNLLNITATTLTQTGNVNTTGNGTVAGNFYQGTTTDSGSGAHAQFLTNSNGNGELTVWAANGSSAVRTRNAGGTTGSPTATASGTGGEFGSWMYNGTSWVIPIRLQHLPIATLSGSDQACKFTFENTPIGSTTRANYATFTALGNIFGDVAVTVPNASAVLQLTSTARGFLAPVMTRAQFDAISGRATGLAGVDSTANKPVFYNGTRSYNGTLELSGSATLDFGSTAAGAQTDLTITVTGAAVGDSVCLGLPAAPAAGIVWNAFVSAADTVTVRASNITLAPVDPASATYKVKVFAA